MKPIKRCYITIYRLLVVLSILFGSIAFVIITDYDPLFSPKPSMAVPYICSFLTGVLGLATLINPYLIIQSFDVKGKNEESTAIFYRVLGGIFLIIALRIAMIRI